MPYSVDLELFPETGLTFSAITGGIWVPPSSFSSSPGTPTFAGTMTSGTSLTFPALTGPPSGTSVMLVSQPPASGVAAFGDLFRSGPVAAFPASPAPLQGGGQASPVMGQAELDNLTSNFTSQTFDVPNSLFWLVGALSGGWIFPVTISVSSAAVTLGTPGSLMLTLTGTVLVNHFNLPIAWTDTYPIAFTELFSLAPSADPVDTSHILAATYTSPALSAPGLFGYAIKPLAPLVADQVTPRVEALINQAIPASVAAELIKGKNQLSPTAVISANKVVISASGFSLILTVADIFGPALLDVQTTVVPDVIGENFKEARADLRAANLKAGGAHLIDPRFVVTGQDPQAGATVPVGTVVILAMGPDV